jgi:hypothetical protein
MFNGVNTPDAQHELRILRLICDPSGIFSEEEWIRASKKDALTNIKRQLEDSFNKH